ncbi:HU family DNA-binding protein [Gordonia alkaliphila]|uniref:HU family DNA-binding protein n=1 Tax=Gordonia alkaliphila TaxID=1053547 RepID=UPI001FF0EAD4|nr:HU family DNA-binding protein [Gordonia alkaliphila]MCK0441173.1 HU family DNA-binding protein [Gordonia alkaliphila]
MATKSTIVAKIAERCDLPSEVVAAVVDEFAVCVIEELGQGEPVTLRTFGSFRPIVRRARRSRNPETGEYFIAKETVVPKFFPSAPFKTAVAEGASANPKIAEQLREAAIRD